MFSRGCMPGKVCYPRAMRIHMISLAVALMIGCAAPADVNDEATAGETDDQLRTGGDPVATFLKNSGFPLVRGQASLPSGFDATVASSVRVKNGKPELPAGLAAPRGGFRTTSASIAQRWIAGAVTSVPGRDRADVVTLRTDAELATATAGKALAKGLVESVGANPTFLTNMDFQGGFADVKADGSIFQGVVIVVGTNRAAIVYAESTD